MSTTASLQTSLRGVLVLPVLALVLSGCAGLPSQVPPSEGGASGRPADSGSSATVPSGDPADAEGGAAIIALGLRYTPADLTVPVGTTVRWVNQEAITHSVTSGAWGEVNESTGLRGTQTADGRFDHVLSPTGEDGDRFEFTFAEPGAYQYFCRPHAGMYGTITVR